MGNGMPLMSHESSNEGSMAAGWRSNGVGWKLSPPQSEPIGAGDSEELDDDEERKPAEPE